MKANFTLASALSLTLALLATAKPQICQAQDAVKPSASTSAVPVVDEVRVLPRAGFASRMIGGQIEGSNESATSGFTTLATLTQAPREGEWRSIKLQNSKPYRFLRYFGPAGSYANIAEIQFLSGSQVLAGTPYGTFGSRHNSGNSFEKAFDGDAKTFFDAPTANSQYLGIEVGAPVPASANEIVAPVVLGKGLRHYHVGNSLTDTIGEYTHQIAVSAGFSDDFVERQTIPGSPLYLNWQSDGGFGMNHNIAFDKLAPLSDLVMQIFIQNGDSDSPEFSLKFYEAARLKSPAIRPWIYGQWTQTGSGKAGVGSPFWEERNLAFMRTYLTHALNFNAQSQVNGGKEALVIPGGLALINLKRAVDAGRVPGMTNFFAANFADDLHGTSAQRYFIGLVTYACLYGKSPVGLPLAKINDDPPALSPAQNTAYQEIAWQTVQDFRGSGGSELGSAVPSEIDARSFVGNAPPFMGSRVNYIPAGRSFTYLLNAPEAGAYELKVSAVTDKPDQKLGVTLNYRELGAVAMSVSQGVPAADSSPLTLDLKAGLNVLRLLVEAERPYELNSLKIVKSGHQLENTLPIFDLSAWNEEIKAGESFVRDFKVSDEETKPDALVVTATSDTPILLPAESLKIESGEFKNQWGQISNRRLTITPAAGQSGEAIVTVTMSDAQDAKRSQSFKVVVK